MPISIFKKKEKAKVPPAGAGSVVGFTKPKKIGFFKIRAKPIFKGGPAEVGAARMPPPAAQPKPKIPAEAHATAERKGFSLFGRKAAKHPEMKPLEGLRPKPPEAAPKNKFALFKPKVQKPQAIKPLPQVTAAAPKQKKPGIFGNMFAGKPRKPGPSGTAWAKLPEMKPVPEAKPTATEPRGFARFGAVKKPAPEAKPAHAKEEHAVGPKAGPSGKTAGYKRPGMLQMYIARVASRHKDLETSLRAEGIKESPYAFVKRMVINAAIISVVVAVALAILLLQYFPLQPVMPVLLAGMLGFACYNALFGRFIQYPATKGAMIGKEIEKDILFAARDMVISMRSGMPLFNAMAAVSTGYGAASREFAKVIELVQLGSPIEEAIDEVSSQSKSKTFKRVMLQASVSLKAGADVVDALQGVVEEASQERVIEMRRYGQRLNALAMFYMLFGVIFPSMGIAIAAILTTFINLFTINVTTLVFVLVGIVFLQVIFLNIVRSSRPTFAM